MPKALVIGAGIGGIASALRLCKKGYEVTVVESNHYAGGKLHAMEQDGYRFDLGPSLFTMPHFVDELFELFHKRPTDYFSYHRKKTICNYFWEDGHEFSVTSDLDVFIKQASISFAEPAVNIEKYLKKK